MERRARTGGSWQRLFSFRHYQGQGTFEKNFCEVLNFWGAIPHIENRGVLSEGQGTFHEVAFHRERVHERKDEKGANWKKHFCGSGASA